MKEVYFLKAVRRLAPYKAEKCLEELSDYLFHRKSSTACSDLFTINTSVFRDFTFVAILDSMITFLDFKPF